MEIEIRDFHRPPASNLQPPTSNQVQSILMADAESTSEDGLEPAAHPLAPTVGAPGEPAPVVVDSPVGIRNVSLSVIATVAVILLLQYASTVFIPFVLAILISHALGPP